MIKHFGLCLLTAFIFSSLTQAQLTEEEDHQCQPPIIGCTCHKGAMSCSGRSVVRFLSVPEDITDFSFVGCQFSGALKIPYVNATSLLFDNCDLTSFADDAFVSHSQLRQLSIVNNPRLLNLSVSSFTNLTSLTKLVLKANGFTGLPNGFFDIFPKLREVDISENDLHVLDGMFDETFSGFTSLKCERCKLTSVPKNILERMTALEDLDLNGNDFTTLSDNSFPALRSLKSLSLDACKIRDISREAFSNLTSLKSLYLANNALVQIQQKTFAPFWETLRVLHLQNNQFETMLEATAPWTTLVEAKLGGNRWTCDCMISWMHLLGTIDKENVTCASPESMQGMNIFKTEVNVYCGVLTKTRTAVVLGISIPVIIICLVLIGYYVYQILSNRRRQTRERNSSFKYRSVYGDTVETNSKQHILS